MKILHTIYDDTRNPWCGGGGAVRALEINRRLVERHDITRVSGCFPGCRDSEIVEGIRVHRIGTSRSYALSRLSYSLLLPLHLRRQRFDLWVHDFSAFAPVWAPGYLRRRAVLVLHHLMSRHATEKYRLAGLAAWLAESLIARLYRRIIAVSPGTRLQAVRLAGQDAEITVVYNGVDDRCFISSTPEGDYLLCFGRLDTYNKGIDLLFEAFARLADSHPEIRLVVAGRGVPERVRELEKLAGSLSLADRIEVLGEVTESRKRELYTRALFVCAPSRYEGWGIAALEASAAGKAVVGSDIPGLADAVRRDETGLLVPPEDVDALAEAMGRLLRDPALTRSLGQAGRRWAGRFRWDQVAHEQERVYEQAAGNPGPVDRPNPQG
ncbi:MAG: glycosyltransferase family 4 protein [Candidatus Latescibacteria bacterium]|nr:glycosyltransferase family 4 protein [Candidatus Latescibacterota bacterium]